MGGRWSYPIHRSVRIRDNAPIARVSGGNTPVKRHYYLWTWSKSPSREMFNFWPLLRLRSMYSVHGSLHLWCIHIFSDINTLNHRCSLENRSCMLFWVSSYNLLCFMFFYLIGWFVGWFLFCWISLNRAGPYSSELWYVFHFFFLIPVTIMICLLWNCFN